MSKYFWLLTFSSNCMQLWSNKSLPCFVIWSILCTDDFKQMDQLIGMCPYNVSKLFENVRCIERCLFFVMYGYLRQSLAMWKSLCLLVIGSFDVLWKIRKTFYVTYSKIKFFPQIQFSSNWRQHNKTSAMLQCYNKKEIRKISTS